ncbi:MAG TPA: acetyl-CoA carboxylase biotin carboxyl carrier protein [Gammaproteobacteria bacterium]|jgi:acetyl-CoA carboxylase biotin carboxyl carrier protein|nr:acetyl-CoA carboxylase biotin carboxyl carrier protein [Gammaproteobacteria bacterium]HIK72650.1 acetyl-CoA carboxylase biotin carboxyl carrier protein [Gammaproteobacteria bacterium]
MDIRKVKKLIEMLEESNLEEIEIQEGEESVRLVKNKPYSPVPNESIYSDSSQIVEDVRLGNQEELTQEPSKDEGLGDFISSPMVGTFYGSASPGSKPFVSVGDHVNEGDVVCIVEAMKMMNEIKSEFSGKVLSINVENEQPVEYGQTLFEISK